MKDKELDDLFSDDSTELVEFDLEKIKENIPQYSNEKLCEMIVGVRYFNLEKKVSVICMEELSKRRLAGDQFDFESYIEKEYNSLPVLDFSIPDIRSVLKQAIGKK